jgi:DNA anti-recombination protein RmuC
LGVLHKRVRELQQENESLLKDVDHLKKEIDLSTRTHAEKVKALTEEKNQLLRESEALVDSSITSLHNAVAELSTRMDTMNQIVQSKDRHKASH